MASDSQLSLSGPLWTLKKAVTTLAIAPQTESLTRAGRMAYNVMIWRAQRMAPDAEGGYSAPLSEIVKGFGATTRDSHRIRAYIEQMCSTVVKWFPLAVSDDPQSTIDGVDPIPNDAGGEGRIFTLLAEARLSRRSGEQWVTWFFPPTIKDILIEPSRWAQLDIKELATLSHYASVALYEIAARYKDVPGGLTNRAVPSWWVQTLKGDPETKPREWRKFKNETLKPAIAEISQRTSLDIQLVEYKQGRAVTSVQFAVKRKTVTRELLPVDLRLVEHAASLGVRERDLDLLVDEYGEEVVSNGLAALEGRLRAQPTVPVPNRIGYLRKILRNGVVAPLFQQRDFAPTSPISDSSQRAQSQIDNEDWLTNRKAQINDELNQLAPEQIEAYAALAQASLASSGPMDAALRKRFASKQYRSPLIWNLIRDVYAREKYGPDWRVPVPAVA